MPAASHGTQLHNLQLPQGKPLRPAPRSDRAGNNFRSLAGSRTMFVLSFFSPQCRLGFFWLPRPFWQEHQFWQGRVAVSGCRRAFSATRGGNLGLRVAVIGLLRSFVRPGIAKKKTTKRLSSFLSGKRGSDPRPQPWQGCALPTELFPRWDHKYRAKF